jgi:hypothetical protein
MRHREVRQEQLFENNNSVHVPPLQKEVEEEAIRELVHWMRALAETIGAGAGDEQNKR